MNPDLSIVIPVYNVEKYLTKCLNSILKQELKNFEVILVNDGSTDNSLKVCQEFSNRDARVSVINQKNAGVSAARNAGIKLAIGKYIGFVDPDDWISPKMYTHLLKEAEDNGSDVVICDYFEVRGEVYHPIKINLTSKELVNGDICEQLIKPMIANEQIGMNTVWGCVWRLLIKKELISKHNIYFDESIPLMEDLIFTFNILSVSQKVKYVDECYYYYLIRTGSAVTSFRENLLENNLNVYNKLIASAKKHNKLNELEIFFKYRYITTMIDSLLNICKLENKKSVSAKIKAIKTICNDETLCKYFREVNTNSNNFKWKLILQLTKDQKAFLLFLVLKSFYLSLKIRQ